MGSVRFSDGTLRLYPLDQIYWRLRQGPALIDALQHREWVTELALHNSHQRLSRCQGADHVLADSFVAHRGNEIPDHRQRDVGFEERHAHLAQHVLDVLVGDSRRSAHLGAQ